MQAEARLLVGGFATYQRSRGFSDATVRVRSLVVGLFATWLDPAALLDAQREHVEAFLADRKRCQPCSKNSYLSHLRAFYRWAMREGHTEQDPTALVDRAKTRKRVPRPITETDYFHALRMARPRMRVWLLLAGVGGLRCKEIAGLRVDDVWWDAQLIVVSDPKGTDERTVPLHPVLDLALRVYELPLSGPAFPTDADPMIAYTGRQVSTMGNRYLHGLEIASTMHKLRSRFGTLAYRESRDLMLVAQLMGHKSILTTQEYVAVVPSSDAMAVVSALPVGDQPSLF